MKEIEMESPTAQPKRTRAVLSPFQVQVLRNVFESTPSPPAELRRELEKILGMKQRAIQVWFQNQRQRVKREAATQMELLSGENNFLLDKYVFHNMTGENFESKLKYKQKGPSIPPNLLFQFQSSPNVSPRLQKLTINDNEGYSHLAHRRTRSDPISRNFLPAIYPNYSVEVGSMFSEMNLNEMNMDDFRSATPPTACVSPLNLPPIDKVMHDLFGKKETSQ